MWIILHDDENIIFINFTAVPNHDTHTILCYKVGNASTQGLSNVDDKHHD